MPKGMVSLEKLYHLENGFKGPMNMKAHNSSLLHEYINLGTKQDSRFVNLGTYYTPQEWKPFIYLLK